MKAEVQFWNEYKQRISKNKKTQDSLEQQYEDFCNLIENMGKAQDEFRGQIHELPLAVALRGWVASTSNKKEAQDYLEQIFTLFDSQVFSLRNNRKVITLGDLAEKGQEAHCQIVEAIRNLSGWTLGERESLVRCYIDFAGYLNETIYGLISKAVDLDREETAHKVLSFDMFIEFVQQLSERDSLIAKLLYFGAPTVEDVLSLKYGDLERRKSSVAFQNCSVVYSKHLIQEILKYSGRKKRGDLLFLNHYGKRMERTHLNQCFGRESEKIFNEKITPRQLLATKTKLS